MGARASFTTEVVENSLRATENYKYWGNDIAPRSFPRDARSSPKKLQSSVALRLFSVSSVVKEPSGHSCDRMSAASMVHIVNILSKEELENSG